MSADFKLHCELEAFEKADDPDGNTMRIGGIVTTDDLDKQGERIVQTGLDFSPFLAEGWFNDNHGQKATDVLGYPTAARFVRKGSRLPNGRQARANGWWAEGYLLNTEQGRQTWQLCQALSKSPRKLGFSIEGSVQKRHDKYNEVITRATVKNVAITHCPVNAVGTEMHALAKALIAGGSIANPGSAPGEGFALRQESLDKAPFGQTGSGDNDWESDVDDNDTENLADGDGDHPDNGGWAGLNPHATPMRSPKDGTPPGHIVSKAEADFQIVDELDLIEEWGPILSRQLDSLQPPARLSKAESRIIVAQRFPHLSSAEVDDIIEHARS